MTTRIQLSLFLSGPDAARIEALRRVLDPVQARLIPAHVTLCREDELEGLDAALLQRRLAASGVGALTLDFGAPERFGSHGVLLPCVGGEQAFRALRDVVLGSGAIRLQRPHLTLAHPRNPRAPGNELEAAAGLAGGLSARFASVCRIQQQGDDAWQLLQCFALPAADDRP